jgi:hypothetical protein
MALPSVVTLGSAAFVMVAAVGYYATTASAGTAIHDSHPVTRPHLPSPSKPLTTPRHASEPAHHQPSTAAVPSVLVVLFNNQGVTGVAEQKAAALESAGWNVSATDSWYGKIPSDTVYYPPQLRVAAVKLAKFLHIARLHAAVAPMQFDELTVIFSTG